jgi:hypothetical protein
MKMNIVLIFALIALASSAYINHALQRLTFKLDDTFHGENNNVITFVGNKSCYSWGNVLECYPEFTEYKDRHVSLPIKVAVRHCLTM